MKKHLLFKSLLLLCALIVGTSAWATDVTFTFNTDAGLTELGIIKPGASAGTDLGTDPYTINGVNLTATDGSTNTRVWNSKGTLDLRIYNGGTLTFTAPANITSIVLSGSAVAGFSCGENGTFSAGAWTGNSASVTLTASATGKINTITVTYTGSSVEMPTFSPAAGAVEKGSSVSITTKTAEASIYYTTDGSTPTSSSTLYSGALTINSAQTIKAIAIKGDDKSLVATAEYTIKKVETPTFTVAEGDVIAGTTVEIETATAGATIHYTTDGSDPTASSTTYSSAITIDADMTIKAIAVKDKWDDSDIANATYTVITPIQGYSIDFEANDISRYADWTFTNIASASTTITAHGGTYYGNTDGKTTASITTKEIIAYPGTFTCYISKETGNTTTSNWKIQKSDNGSTWTDVATKSATGMTKGAWQEFKADLSAYKNVYIRLYYAGTTAVRAVDDITLALRPADPTTSGNETYLTTSDNMAGWRAFYDEDNSYSVDVNTTVYVADVDPDPVENKITLKAISGIPAKVPVILHTSSSANSYKMTLTKETVSPYSYGGTNKLIWTSSAVADKYRLGFGASGVGFYPYSGTPASGAVILEVSSAGARELTIGFEDEATGVADVRVKMADGRSDFYNLNGQKVLNPTKGLYIVNGKKVIIK